MSYILKDTELLDAQLAWQMDTDTILQTANSILIVEMGRPLSDLECHVLQSSLVGKSYDEMAEGWSTRTIRDAGFRLWRLFSQALGQDIKVNKSNFQAAILQLAHNPKYQNDSLELNTHHSVQPSSRDHNFYISSAPFIAGPPITHPSDFFGRNRILKRLFKLLGTHPLQNAAIIGPRRSGKTSILNYLRSITTAQSLRAEQPISHTPHFDQYRWVFIDFQDVRMTQRDRLLEYILKSLGLPVPSPCTLNHFLDCISYNIHTPTVILIDEIDVGLQRCPELDDSFWESLRSLASNQSHGNLGFVLATAHHPAIIAQQTGNSSPFFNIFGYTAQLTPFSEAEARELIASSPIPFSKDDTQWIIKMSGQWPILIQILCQERLFSLEEGSDSTEWQEDALQQISAFRYLLESS